MAIVWSVSLDIVYYGVKTMTLDRSNMGFNVGMIEIFNYYKIKLRMYIFW
jgi:hypothetical protein